MQTERAIVTRRDLLSLIGAVSGSAAMYHAMTSLGFASDSGYKGPIKLEGDPRGASVLILGAGLAGMTAALELRKAGYDVRILEFSSRQRVATGRCGAGIRSRNSAASGKPASSNRVSTSIPGLPLNRTNCCQPANSEYGVAGTWDSMAFSSSIIFGLRSQT